MTFRPKYITFDCYGTLTYYPMHQAAYDIYEGQLPPQELQSFIKTFNDYRFDEAMGDWKPYLDILHSSLERACRKHKLAFRDEHAKRIYDAVPTWGPHADVIHELKRIAPATAGLLDILTPAGEARPFPTLLPPRCLLSVIHWRPSGCRPADGLIVEGRR